MFRAATSTASSSARASSLHLLRKEVPCHRQCLVASAGQRAYSDQAGDAAKEKEKAKKRAKKAKQGEASSSGSSTTPKAPVTARSQRAQPAAKPPNRARVPLSVVHDLDVPFQSPFSAYQSPTSWDPNEDTGMALADPQQARLQEERLRKAFDSPRRYVAMVVDVDSLKPPLDLMQHGYEGGTAWHARCIKRIRTHLGVPPHHELDVRMYLFANQAGLSAWYDRQHGLQPRTFFEFCRGVTEAGPITIFTDAGRKDQAADQKVKAFMTDCLMDPSLIHLYLGGLNDYGYVPELTALRTMHLLDKVSLLFLPGPALTSRHYGEYQKRVVMWTDCFEDLGNQKSDLRWKASELAAATWHRMTQMLPQADPVTGKFSPDQGASPFSTLAAAPGSSPDASPSPSSAASHDLTSNNSPVPSSLNMPDSFVKFVYLHMRWLYPEDARAELRSRDRAGTGTGYGFGFSSDRSGGLRDGNANADARARAQAPENSMLNVPGARDFSEEKGGYKRALRKAADEGYAKGEGYHARLPEQEAREIEWKYEQKGFGRR